MPPKISSNAHVATAGFTNVFDAQKDPSAKRGINALAAALCTRGKGESITAPAYFAPDGTTVRPSVETVLGGQNAGYQKGLRAAVAASGLTEDRQATLTACIGLRANAHVATAGFTEAFNAQKDLHAKKGINALAAALCTAGEGENITAPQYFASDGTTVRPSVETALGGQDAGYQKGLRAAVAASGLTEDQQATLTACIGLRANAHVATAGFTNVFDAQKDPSAKKGINGLAAALCTAGEGESITAPEYFAPDGTTVRPSVETALGGQQSGYQKGLRAAVAASGLTEDQQATLTACIGVKRTKPTGATLAGVPSSGIESSLTQGPPQSYDAALAAQLQAQEDARRDSGLRQAGSSTALGTWNAGDDGQVGSSTGWRTARYGAPGGSGYESSMIQGPVALPEGVFPTHPFGMSGETDSSTVAWLATQGAPWNVVPYDDGQSTSSAVGSSRNKRTAFHAGLLDEVRSAPPAPRSMSSLGISSLFRQLQTDSNVPAEILGPYDNASGQGYIADYVSAVEAMQMAYALPDGEPEKTISYAKLNALLQDRGNAPTVAAIGDQMPTDRLDLREFWERTKENYGWSLPQLGAETDGLQPHAVLSNVGYQDPFQEPTMTAYAPGDNMNYDPESLEGAWLPPNTSPSGLLLPSGFLPSDLLGYGGFHSATVESASNQSAFPWSGSVDVAGSQESPHDMLVLPEESYSIPAVSRQRQADGRGSGNWSRC